MSWIIKAEEYVDTEELGFMNASRELGNCHNNEMVI